MSEEREPRSNTALVFIITFVAIIAAVILFNIDEAREYFKPESQQEEITLEDIAEVELLIAQSEEQNTEVTLEDIAEVERLIAQSEGVPSIFDIDADVLDQPSKKFSFEVWELVKDYWTEEMPVEHPKYSFRAALITDESTYLQWNAWACPNGHGMRYRLEKFVNAAEASGASVKFGNVRIITGDSQGYQDMPGCIGLYVLEEDYSSFSEAITEYECSSNHTPCEVGQTVYAGPWLNSIYKKAAEEEKENLKYYEENDIYVPEDYLSHYRMVAGIIDQPAEITKICEGDVYVRFENGYERDMPWEWLVRDPLR